jgi:hypothetical protein
VTAARGVVFGATGADYVALAARAAETVRRCMPGLPIDLFTDAAVDLPAFDRIHLIPERWRHAKLDALVSSRFERTLYLDSDIFMAAPVDDVFETLDRFDVALAHDAERNSPLSCTPLDYPLPAAFPQFNGGVIAVRRNPATAAFLARWRDRVRDGGHRYDQPSLRQLLWESDLRIATLPEEYNLTQQAVILTWGRTRPAPRILHSPRLHHHFTRGGPRIDSVAALLGPGLAPLLPELLAADRNLARAMGGEPARPSHWARRMTKLRVGAGLLRVGLGKLVEDLGRLARRRG